MLAMQSSNYSVGLSEIHRLMGETFAMPSEVLQSVLRFRIETASEGTPKGPRRGEEAYGMLADCDHPAGLIPSFLKIFKVAAPSRLERIRFLIRLALFERHWMFQGMPYCSLNMREVAGVKILGHLSRQVLGRRGEIAPSLRCLIESGWRCGIDIRRRLAGQLCCAVYVLESMNLVHGDLSLGNVLIGRDASGLEVAVLCDFDGFYHPSQPLLPLEYEGKPVRRCGSDGFFYPELLEQISERDPDVCVRTDRLALGALICQIMVWGSETAEKLGRYELLGNSDISSRSLSGLPPDILEGWPQGFGLLEEGLKATSLDAIPSPRRWLEELGGPPIPLPVLKIRNRNRSKWERIVCLRTPQGTLQSIDSELRSVIYRRTGGSVSFLFKWQAEAPLMVKRGRGLLPGRISSDQATLEVGGKIVSVPWELEYVEDYSPGSV